jgi:hypothetical protein
MYFPCRFFPATPMEFIRLLHAFSHVDATKLSLHILSSNRISFTSNRYQEEIMGSVAIWSDGLILLVDIIPAGELPFHDH